MLNNDRKEFRKEMKKKSHCVADFIEKVLMDHTDATKSKIF